jgi:hypothetical protein
MPESALPADRTPKLLTKVFVFEGVDEGVHIVVGGAAVAFGDVR